MACRRGCFIMKFNRFRVAFCRKRVAGGATSYARWPMKHRAFITGVPAAAIAGGLARWLAVPTIGIGIYAFPPR
jgi:hypothetical protein